MGSVLTIVCQARRHDAALQWMHILSEEFSRQASMEGELEITSSLMAPPKKDIASLSKAQLSFMNLFAIPLFQGVADILPGMQYTVDELEINKGHFERTVEEEKAKEQLDDPGLKRLRKEGTLSPRTMSYAVGMEENNKESSPQNDDRPGRTIEGIAEVLAETPGSLIDDEQRSEEALDPPPSNPTRKPTHIPQSIEEYKEVNGSASNFDAVRQLASSDPFNAQGHAKACKTDDDLTLMGKHRCSETTEGSTSAGVAGDWASQGTSATGKMPMSPSTKGTSVVSKESADRPTSAPGPDRRERLAVGKDHEAVTDEHSTSTGGSLGKAEGKALRKKSSRFRMKDFPFFRRHKGSNQAYQTTDTAS